jgi:AraC-like DNA-binding protein
MDYQLNITVDRRSYRLEVDDFGRVCYDDFVPDWHWHAVYHLILVNGGSFYVEFQAGEKLRIDEKTLLFINSRVRHRFSRVPGVRCEHVGMLWRFVDSNGLSAAFPLQVLYGENASAAAPYLICPLNEMECIFLRDRHQRLLNILRDQAVTRPLQLLFFDLWVSFFDLVMSKQGAYRAEPLGQLAERISLILRESIADAGFSNQKLAELLGKHPNYLNLCYRRATGRSIRQTLLQLRLRQAAEMLAGGKLQIAEIAEQCGFRRANYFSKIFTDHYSLSPLAFRRDANNMPGFLRTAHYRVGTPEDVPTDGVSRRSIREI